MKLVELIGFLRTYEIGKRPERNDKTKNTTFTTDTKEHVSAFVPEEYQAMMESFALFIINFGKSSEWLKKMEENYGKYIKQKKGSNNNSQENGKSNRSFSKNLIV